MTSTSFNVGLTSGTRNSSKVLKPPGGGSSDIFGPADQPEPRKGRAQPQQQSSLFMSHDEPTPIKSKAGNETDSHVKLFGDLEPRFSSAAKNKDRFKSNIVLGGDNTPPQSKAHRQILSNAEAKNDDSDGVGVLSENGTESGSSKNDTNAVTGNGYHKVDGTNSEQPQPQQPVQNGSAPPPTQSAAAPRQRVPPGGFSSGLW